MATKEESAVNELALLGSVMLDPPRVMPILLEAGCRDKWFCDARSVTLWSAMRRMYDAGDLEAMDYVTVMDSVKTVLADRKDEGEPAVIDGAWMQRLIDETPTSAHAEYYTQIVKNQYVGRKARRMVSGFVSEMDAGPAQAIQGMMTKLTGLLEEMTKGGAGDDRGTLIDAVMARFEEAHRIVMVEGKGKVRYCPGLRMPWEYMTMLYAGVGPGLHIVSGRPSTGKTALMNNLLRFWCDGLGLAGGLNSLDMTRENMWARNFAEMSRVSLPKATFGMTSRDEMTRLKETGERLKKWRLDMRVCHDVDEFRSWVTLGVMKRGWKFCVVDFIQLLNFRECSRMSVDDRTAYISGAVKRLGNDLGIPMFALSQLNRECERDGGRPPKASDLRGGGSLEQDAATVLMLRKDDRTQKAFELAPPKHLTPFGSSDSVQTYLAKRLRPVWASLEKNQQGPVGEVPFVFYKNYFLFRLADYKCEPERVEREGKEPAHLDYTPMFCRVHPDWREHAEDEALRKSGGLVTEYRDGEE